MSCCSAKTELHQRHVHRARRVARRTCAFCDVEDVVQEAFMSAFESLSQLRDGDAFAAWFSTLVARRARLSLRRQRMLRRLGFARPDEADCESLASERALPPDVHAELANVCGMLEGLPRDGQIAFVLRRLEGRTVAEVAMAMDISESTAKRHVRLVEEALSSRVC